MKQTELVLEAVKGDLSILKMFPPTLQIYVLGMVPTPCYGNARLEPFYYVNPPEDGIWDFSFVADNPGGICTQVITPITAVYYWPDYPQELKGVRIHTKTNKLEIMLNQMAAVEVKSLKA
jgi:hypothetical protein